MALLPFAKTIFACWRTLVPPCMCEFTSRRRRFCYSQIVFYWHRFHFSCFPGWEKTLLLFINCFLLAPIALFMFSRVGEDAFVIHKTLYGAAESFSHVSSSGRRRFCYSQLFRDAVNIFVFSRVWRRRFCYSQNNFALTSFSIISSGRRCFCYS